MNWVEICICLLTVEGGAQYFTKPSIRNPSLTEKRVIVPRITIRPSTMPAIMWRFLARGENIIRKEGEGEGVSSSSRSLVCFSCNPGAPRLPGAMLIHYDAKYIACKMKCLTPLKALQKYQIPQHLRHFVPVPGGNGS